MIQLETSHDGVILPVRAQPGSKNNGLRGEQNGALKVSVTQIAEKGKANKALQATLCKALKLRRSQLELLSGHTAAQKKFLVRDIAEPELRQRIQQATAKTAS